MEDHPHACALYALAALLDDDRDTATDHLNLMPFTELKALALAARALARLCCDTFAARIWANLEADE